MAFLRGRAAWEQQQREEEVAAAEEELERLLAAAESAVSCVIDATPSRGLNAALDGAARPLGAPTEVSRKPLQLRVAEAQDALKGLRQLQRQLDVLQAEEARSDSSTPAAALFSKLDNSYKRLHSELQQAQVAARAPVASGRDQQLLSQRALLLGETSTMSGTTFPRKRQLRSEEERAAAAADITQSLRRTHQVMAQEVERGVSTMEVMDDSASTLQKSSGQYSQQKGKLGTAHSRLTQMQQMDRMDRLILLLGSLFFSSVCTYILYWRIPLLRSLSSALISAFCALFFDSSDKRGLRPLPGTQEGSTDAAMASW